MRFKNKKTGKSWDLMKNKLNEGDPLVNRLTSFKKSFAFIPNLIINYQFILTKLLIFQTLRKKNRRKRFLGLVIILKICH